MQKLKELTMADDIRTITKQQMQQFEKIKELKKRVTKFDQAGMYSIQISINIFKQKKTYQLTNKIKFY